LLATVVGLDSDHASLKYDARYEIQPPDNICTVDVASLLITPMKFRPAE